MNVLPKILFQLNKKQIFLHRFFFTSFAKLFNLGKLWSFYPSFYVDIQFPLTVFFAWLEGRKDVVRSFHFIYCLFPFWFSFICCKLTTLSRLVLHSELGIGWPKKLDIIFQKLSADFDILLQDDQGQCSGIIQVALTTACQLSTLLSIESYFKWNVVSVFHSVLKTFHTEFKLCLP